MTSTKLKRAVTLPALILYGVGTMVGGGFYALLGEITVEAGSATPLALLLSGVLALLSACSFAELSSRYPVSAGEARYVGAAFRLPALSTTVGWLVISTGVVSAATLSVATTGFIRDMWPMIPGTPGIVALVLLLGIVAVWGIGESVAVVVVVTVLEVAALLYAFGVNAAPLAELPSRWPELLPSGAGGVGWLGVFGGAFLAFYAFIGFEDMVNIAEEVRDARRTLPRAILVSVVLTTVLYVAVSTAAVLSVPLERLAGSATPIAELVRDGGARAATGVWAVSVLTGVNGALVQIIMASRVAYGLARRSQAPAVLAKINRTTRTPVIATALVTAIVLALALFFPLTTLAKITSSVILIVFATVNLALWRIKRRDPDEGGAGPRFPPPLPLVAFAATVLVLGFELWLALP